MRHDDMLFPTMVVGSLPRPRWVQDIIVDRLSGRISVAQADRLLDDAVLTAIRLQERAGLDYVSDGEWRRENYARMFADGVGGFERREVKRGPLTLQAFVVDTLVPGRPIARREAQFLREHTDRKTIVALPTPCTIGNLMWHPEHSRAAYPTMEAFVWACVPIIRNEVISLAELGVDAIQLDEPLLPRLADPRTYGYDGLADLEEAAEFSVQTINEVAAGLDGLFLTVHLCHAHGDEYRATPGAKTLMMSAVRRMKVDRFAMEFNSPAAQGLQALEDFPDDKVLGLGVIEPRSPEVESPETVVRRAEKALEFVDAGRLVLNPDCGFATSAGRSSSLDRAYLKLTAMCRGAEMLREAHG
jgi:5-methyltetrahydropteroyltriglutamate--homocysteine methyltransferase